MFAPVNGAAYTMTTKREARWSEETKAQNTEKGMYVGLKQPRGDGKRYVTAKETKRLQDLLQQSNPMGRERIRRYLAPTVEFNPITYPNVTQCGIVVSGVPSPGA